MPTNKCTLTGDERNILNAATLSVQKFRAAPVPDGAIVPVHPIRQDAATPHSAINHYSRVFAGVWGQFLQKAPPHSLEVLPVTAEPQQLNMLGDELQEHEPDEIMAELPTGLHENMEELFRIAGTEKALEIIKVFAGQNVYFPTLRTLDRPFRDQAIRAKSAEGLRVGQLAREFGLSESQVRRILGGRNE